MSKMIIAAEPRLNIIKNGLILWLDASLRTSYPASGTTWNDLSGAGKTGTLVNGPIYRTDNGGCIDFDGTNDVVTASANLGISGNANLTIAYWSRWDTAAWGFDYPTPFSNTTFSVDGANVSTTWADGRPAIDFWNRRVRVNTALAVQTWYYTAYTKTAGLINTTNCLIYVNGTSVARAVEGSTTTPNITNSPYILGRLDAAAGRYWNGKVAQLTVYNRVLTADEIVHNFNVTRGRFGV